MEYKHNIDLISLPKFQEPHLGRFKRRKILRRYRNASANTLNSSISVKDSDKKFKGKINFVSLLRKRKIEVLKRKVQWFY